MISLVALLVGLAVCLAPFAFVIILVAMLGKSKRRPGLSDDQARQLDQVWKRLERLESRIINLETILADPRK